MEVGEHEVTRENPAPELQNASPPGEADPSPRVLIVATPECLSGPSGGEPDPETLAKAAPPAPECGAADREIEFVACALRTVAQLSVECIKQSELGSLAGRALLCVCGSTPDFCGALRALRAVRAAGERLPVLAVGGHWDRNAVAPLLDAGADDCLVDGVTQNELSARVRALLRRSLGLWILHAPLTHLDYPRQAVRLGTRQVTLSSRQFWILEYLIRHADQWCTPEAILRDVFKSRHEKGSSVVRFHVHHLRRAFGEHAWCLRGHRGRGYMFSTASGPP